MTRIYLQSLFAAASVVLLTACNVKDTIYNTAHPADGQITLTTDWSQIGEGLTVPESYKVCIGDYTTTVSGATNTLDRHFAPGTYRMLIYNTPENIYIDGTVANTGLSHELHHPGWLFTYSAEVTISKDTDHALTAVMKQQTRRFNMVVEPTGDAADRIERITGFLSWVADKFDMVNETYLAPLMVVADFSKIADGPDAGKWSHFGHTFGFIQERPIALELDIHYKDGNPAMQTITSDLTEVLAGFNDNKREPFTLDGTIVETPTEAGFTATITDWTVVEGDPVVAE